MIIDATPERVTKAHTIIMKFAPAMGENILLAVLDAIGLSEWARYDELGRFTLNGLPNLHVVTLAAALGAVTEANPNGFD